MHDVLIKLKQSHGRVGSDVGAEGMSKRDFLLAQVIHLCAHFPSTEEEIIMNEPGSQRKTVQAV